jgi:trehalose 6-phosphate phosphatase
MRAAAVLRRTATCNCSSSSATTISSSLDPFRSAPGEAAGILLDFDGTLAEIVAEPGLARPLEGVAEVLSRLVTRYALVVVISGRPDSEVRDLLDVDGLSYVGSYGLTGSAVVQPDHRLIADLREMCGSIPGTWVEEKGLSAAVHYRRADDPVTARSDVIAGIARVLDARSGFEMIEGKMVAEVVPAGAARKGGVVERLVRDHGLSSVLFAGDDLPDLEAFAALDGLAEEGVTTMKVAVQGAETPLSLAVAADVVVDGPTGLLDLLRQLD